MTKSQCFRLQLGLDLLANLTFHDIIQKLSPENIVEELFSEFAARLVVPDSTFSQSCVESLPKPATTN